MADIQLNSVCYYKTEIDDMLSEESARVNAAIGLKLDSSSVSAPAGVAGLTSVGKHKAIEIPFATIAEAMDETNDFTVMNPKRTTYLVKQLGVAADTIGVANGVAPLGTDGLVPDGYLPPSRIYMTYVVDTLAEMHALVTTNTIVRGDRCVITNEPTDVNNAHYRDWETDRKSTRLNSSHSRASRMPSSS